MADRTYLQLHVHACPPDQLDALAYALGALPYNGDWDLVHAVDPPVAPIASHGPDPFQRDDEWWQRVGEAADPLPWHLAVEEVVCGFLSSEADLESLSAAAPGAAWEAWEDPKYEYEGDWHAYHPDLGHLASPCNADGQATPTADTAAALLAEMPDADGLIERDAVVDVLFPSARFRRLVKELDDPAPLPA